MHNRSVSLLAALFVASMTVLTACSSDGTTSKVDDHASGTGGSSPENGAIDVTIAGEELATAGILFPQGSEVAIADGWEIQFTHILVTVDKITLSENPDKNPSDQSQVDGVVAEVDGPWAVDLHKEGSAPGAGGEGTAIQITSIATQNKNGSKPFDADKRYAFGYDIVAASDQATKVNLDAEAEAAYGDMIAKGYSVLYVGSATFKGTACESSDATYDFKAIPTTVKFRLGFTTPVSNLNCQNQENQGDAFQGEEYQRGIAIPSNKSATAQMTLHIDHPFFADVEHDPALYFDQIAARLVGKPEGTEVTLEDLAGVDPTAFTDGAGTALPWRICDGSELPASTQRSFAVGSVPVNPAGTPATALRDYRDYIQYVQSTQGHLNGGEGLCFIKRNYPSPP